MSATLITDLLTMRMSKKHANYPDPHSYDNYKKMSRICIHNKFSGKENKHDNHNK